MEASAIREINGQAIAATAAISAAITAADVGNIPAAALPSDIKIHTLEHLLPNRTRLRGSYETHEIKSFVAYAEPHAERNVFIDEKAMKATAIFNLGDKENPGHCDLKALLKLQKTPELESLLRIAGQPISQKTLAEWMEDFRDFITCNEILDGPFINIKLAISSIRKLTIAAMAESTSSVGDFSANRSAMESIEAKAEALPAIINFQCLPYMDLTERTFSARLSVITKEKEPTFVLRIILLEKHEQEMAEELVKILETDMPKEGTNIFIGQYTP